MSWGYLLRLNLLMLCIIKQMQTYHPFIRMELLFSDAFSSISAYHAAI
jgi:hypothetical protein